MQTIFPALRYNDARTAIQWLCDAFGFTVLFSVPETGAVVRHAQLELGSNIVMVGSVRPDDGIKSPRDLGFSTQALCVSVNDVEAHFQRALTAGAHITSAPHFTDFGAREYYVSDLEGHPWVFTSYLPKP